MRAKFPDVSSLALQPLLAAMQRLLFLAWTLRRGMLVHGVRTPQDYLVGRARLFHQRTFDWLDALFATPGVETHGVSGTVAGSAGVR